MLYIDSKNPDASLIGNIQFRLGWALIRLKTLPNINLGIEHLKVANKCLPNNTEILIKLANVVYKELNAADEAMFYI
jgi:hypothetical protein